MYNEINFTAGACTAFVVATIDLPRAPPAVVHVPALSLLYHRLSLSLLPPTSPPPLLLPLRRCCHAFSPSAYTVPVVAARRWLSSTEFAKRKGLPSVRRGYLTQCFTSLVSRAYTKCATVQLLPTARDSRRASGRRSPCRERVRVAEAGRGAARASGLRARETLREGGEGKIGCIREFTGGKATVGLAMAANPTRG